MAFQLSRSGTSFLREIVIVVLGVLIALVMQEALGNWRDQQRTQTLLATMQEELSDNMEVLSLRLRVNPCMEAKLDSLDARLRRAGAGGPWTNVGRPPFFFSSQDAWNSSSVDLLSRQTNSKTYGKYSSLYRGMAQYDALAAREQDYWTVLRSLEQQDEPVTGQRRWDLIKALSSARNAARILNAIAKQETKTATDLGIKPTAQLAKLPVETSALCQLLGTEVRRT